MHPAARQHRDRPHGGLARRSDPALTGSHRLEVITRGFNVATSEMEAVVAELPGVIETCVVSAFDAKFVESPAAIVYTNRT